MSSRYDNRTTTFSPEGRLYQVEYAVEAISQAGAAIGVLTKEGVVLATEKRAQHPLLDSEAFPDKNISGEKVYKVADHICCAVAGITSDANILIDYVRRVALQHAYTYQEPMATEDLCAQLCDLKQSYTQYGSVRPFGVGFLVAGWDRHHGFQLYHTDPSGNYSAWKAQAIGNSDQVAQSLLRQEWKEGLTLHEGILLALKLLGKTMDLTSLSVARVEVATLSLEPTTSGVSALLSPGTTRPATSPRFTILNDTRLKPLIDEADKIRAAEEAAEAAAA